MKNLNNIFETFTKEIYIEAGVDIYNPLKFKIKNCIIETYQINIDIDLIGPKGISNADRMHKGLAPYIEENGYFTKIDLHHHNQNTYGPLIELSKEIHVHGNEILHKGPARKNVDDLPTFTYIRKLYWKNRIKNLELQKRQLECYAFFVFMYFM